MTKLKREIEALKRRLVARAKKGGLYEDFGQKEVRKLKDKYDYSTLTYGTEEQREQAREIDKFEEWCNTYI